MYVSYESSEGLQFIERVNKVEDNGEEIVIDNQNDTVRDNGDIVNINGADCITIVNYFGSEISRISATDDVINMNKNKLILKCSDVQQISNRVVLEFDDGRTVDINGKIKSARVDA